MPKYWGKQIFTHGRFPEVGQKQKTEKKRKKDRKHVIAMASYALQRHLGWRTQSRLGQKIKKVEHPIVQCLLYVPVCANVKGEGHHTLACTAFLRLRKIKVLLFLCHLTSLLFCNISNFSIQDLKRLETTS